jgi:hypothetical protein
MFAICCICDLVSRHRIATEPRFFFVALCFVLMLCAHALSFVLCAPCSCFVLIGFFGHRSPSTKYAHEACARSRWPAAAGGRSCSQKSGLFVAHGQTWSTKHEHKAANYDQKMWFWALSTKHKAQSISTKQRPKNGAQFTRSMRYRVAICCAISCSDLLCDWVRGF